MEIFNQIAETLRVGDLAKLVSDKTGCGIRYLENPRKEDAENDLEASRLQRVYNRLYVLP